MRGIIVNYENNEGIASGQNRERYQFTLADLASVSKPKAGMEIDFEIEGSNAKKIFIIPTNMPLLTKNI